MSNMFLVRELLIEAKKRTARQMRDRHVLSAAAAVGAVGGAAAGG